MPLKINDILQTLQQHAPYGLQESYDNSGLLVGDRHSIVDKALVCIDINEAVIDEAIRENCSLIISHHPLIFNSLKQLTHDNPIQRLVIKVIQNRLSVIAMHTNLDNAAKGVNHKIALKLGLSRLSVLQPMAGVLRKIVTYCPEHYTDKIREAMSSAGAGSIGNYDSCSYSVSGTGSFRAGPEANPFVGISGELHRENETRLEMIVPEYHLFAVIAALKQTHPYEEVAYDVYTLNNEMPDAGAGIIGEWESAKSETEYLEIIKQTFGTPSLRHSALSGRKIQRIALCGGSGAFLIPAASRAKVDAYLTADVKYHDFFDADPRMLVVDAGHFETEQFTKELIIEIIQEKFSTFALLNSEINTNPVYYYQ